MSKLVGVGPGRLLQTRFCENVFELSEMFFKNISADELKSSNLI